MSNGLCDERNADSDTRSEVDRAYCVIFNDGKNGAGQIVNVNIILNALRRIQNRFFAGENIFDQGTTKTSRMFSDSVRIKHSRPTQRSYLRRETVFEFDAQIIFPPC